MLGNYVQQMLNAPRYKENTVRRGCKMSTHVWTIPQQQEIKSRLDAGERVSDIAKDYLKYCALSSVLKKIYSIRNNGIGKIIRVWTDEEDKILVEMKKRGCLVKEISQVLGRSENGINSRWRFFD